jgi:DNA polymerase I-like protein with 3'-5' exonuclease and polymerase domains
MTMSTDFVAVDYHVTGRRSAVDVLLGRSQLVGLSVTDCYGQCHYFSHDFQNVVASLSTRRRVYHDAVFAHAVELRNGLARPSGGVDCTRTMGHLLDENTSHDFHVLIRHYADNLTACGPAQNHGNTSANELVPLNSACLPWLLYVRGEQPRRIVAEQLQDVYGQIELPLIEPIVSMAEGGIRLDLESLRCVIDSHQVQLGIAQCQLEQIAGRRIELTSPADVSKLLFDQLGLPVTATTKSGAPSTAQEDLELLRNYHLAVGLVLRGRHLQTVVSFAESLFRHADMHTGRVHPGLDPLGAITGRLSCGH